MHCAQKKKMDMKGLTLFICGTIIVPIIEIWTNLHFWIQVAVCASIFGLLVSTVDYHVRGIRKKYPWGCPDIAVVMISLPFVSLLYEMMFATHMFLWRLIYPDMLPYAADVQNIGRCMCWSAFGYWIGEVYWNEHGQVQKTATM